MVDEMVQGMYFEIRERVQERPLQLDGDEVNDGFEVTTL